MTAAGVGVDVPWFNNFGEAAPTLGTENVGASSMSTLSAVDKISACSLVSPTMMTRCASSGALLAGADAAAAAAASAANRRSLRATKSMRSASESNNSNNNDPPPTNLLPSLPTPPPALPPPQRALSAAAKDVQLRSTKHVESIEVTPR